MVFDVASIREYRADGGMRYIDNMPHNSYYHAEGSGLWGMILAAYDLHIVTQLENLPHWGFETMYTINAKSDPATDAALEKLSDSDAKAEKRHMLQVLLAERFKLKIHPETRESTTYELVATPRAAKLMTPVQGDVGKTISSCNPKPSKKGIEIESKGCPFTIFFSDLQQMMGANVVDHTGMTGVYAYHLMHRPPTWPQHTDEEQFPDTVDAVREQLGLELKKTKGPVTFWVVDHVERPTPN